MAAAAIPWILGGLGGLAGIFGNRPQTTTSNSQSNTSSNQSGQSTTDTGYSNYGTSTPTMSPLGTQISNTLGRYYLNRINPNDVNNQTQNITTAALQNNNRGSAISKQLAQSTMAARGLGYSPASAVAGNNIDQARIGANVGVVNQSPLIAEQLMQQRLNDANNFFRGLPVGTTTAQVGSQTGNTQSVQSGTSQTDQTGSQTGPGNMTGGGIGGIAGVLGGLYGRGAFGQQAP